MPSDFIWRSAERVSYQRQDRRTPADKDWGKPQVNYPDGLPDFPQIIETKTARQSEQVPSALSAHPNATDFPNAKLTTYRTEAGGNRDANWWLTYETLPGPIFVEITSYRETGVPMLTSTRKVAATADYTEGEIVPAAVNVASIADNGDGTCTVTLAGAHDLPPKAWVRFAGTNSTPALGQQTSGTLTVGAFYTISTFSAGDNFTNVGASSNATGVSFTATGTTPTTYSHGSALTRALRIVSVPAVNAVIIAATLSGAGTAAGTMTAINRIVRELKKTPNANILIKIDTMVAVPDVSVYNENFKCWKDYDFPDFLTAINFYAAGSSVSGAPYNSHTTYGGAIGLPMQDGYRGPCRARRLRFFFVGPPPDSFEEGFSPTFVMPSSGTFVIQGGSQSVIYKPDLSGATVSTSVSYRTGRIPHCLTGPAPTITVIGGGSANATLNLPVSVPAKFTVGDIITLIGQPSKYDAGALWEAIVWLIVVPYTSGSPPP